MPDVFDHCETLVRAVDKDRYVATLFAPAQCRGPLFALYAFNDEIARVREAAREPMPGEIRLQWWRDVLSGAGAGAGAGEGSPVATAIADTMARYRLPVDVLTELVEARSFDLYDDPMGSLAELTGYAERTSAAVMALAAQVLNGGEAPPAGALCRHAGIASAIVSLLEAFGAHARRRQLYVPLDLLQRHGARADDVFAGIATPAIKAALAELRTSALGHLAEARALLPAMPRALAPAILPAALVRPALQRMERDRDPCRPRLLPSWRRQWLMWRAARRADVLG